MTKNILLSALVLFGAVSCVKDPFDESLGERVTITLTAENPGFASDAAPASKSVSGDSTAAASASVLAPIVLDSTATMEESIAALGDRVVYSDSTMFICAPQDMAPDTKTGMDKDGNPFWEKDDKLGLFVVSTKGEYSCIPLSMQENKASYKAIFTGSVDYTIKNTWPFYPFKEQVSPSWEKLVSLEISNQQTPSRPNSFDGNSDILVGSKLQIQENTSISINENITLTRKVGFLKFALFDMQQEPIDDYIKTLTFSVSDYPNLVGTCTLKLDTGELNIISGGNACTVTYLDDVKTSAAFISAFPGNIPANSTLLIKGETVGKKSFTVEKQIQKAINIAENQYTYIGLQVKFESKPEISKTNAWQNFLDTNTALKNETDPAKRNELLSNRILLDYSYAGYMHGTAVPPTMAETGWRVIDVKKDCGAKGDGKTYDRPAFLKALSEAGMYKVSTSGKVGSPIEVKEAKVVIYFPPGTYLLHDERDNSTKVSVPDKNGVLSFPAKDSNGRNASNAIILNAGNFIIAGAGPKETKLLMGSEMLPNSEKLYSSPELILVKNPTLKVDNPVRTCNVVGNTIRGSHSVIVDQNLSGWVMLCMDAVNPTDDLLRFEFGGHNKITDGTTMDDIKKKVVVRDFHKVKNSVDLGNGTFRVTFEEPIMREINLERDGKDAKGQIAWYIAEYTPYTNVGIENLTFVGKAKENFTHHASWQDDGGYKPLTFTGLADSWIMNVNFESISECVSFKSCANCTAFNIAIGGNRGHAGLRSAGSSRIFLGNIYDHSAGYTNENQQITDKYEESAGQYHASGVSKPSMGAVLWRNQWGTDATFESHSGQPRATLVDHCKGGWVEKRFGGDRSDIPNHLGDLCIWNMEAVNYRSPTFVDAGYNSGKFQFWYDGQDKLLWRVTPPIIVGFHGGGVTFDESSDQIKYKESIGQPVSTPSLYEAQLELRLPTSSWLGYLQRNTLSFGQ